MKFRVWHKPSQAFTESHISEVTNDTRLRYGKKYLQFRTLKRTKTVKEIFESISGYDKKKFIYCSDKLFYRDGFPLYINLVGEVEYFCTEYEDSYACSTGEEYAVQQWTGLIDVNNKEIYVDDVLKPVNDLNFNRLKVLFNPEHGFVGMTLESPRKKKRKKSWVAGIRHPIIDGFEICGNMYEGYK